MIGKSLRILIEKAMAAIRIDDQLSVRNPLLEVKAVNSREHAVILELEWISEKTTNWTGRHIYSKASLTDP